MSGSSASPAAIGPSGVLGSIGRKLIMIFAAIGVLFAVVSAVAYSSVGSLTENARMVAHTYQVLGRIEAVRSGLKDAETGQRGYLITGRDDYLAPYQ
jgi:methyl-accepting chemotaxis protein